MGNNPEELLKTAEQEEYHHLVNRSNWPPLLKNCIWAFVVGGLICVVRQIMEFL